MGNDAYYFSVENPGGMGSQGYVAFQDGSVFPAVSGNATHLDTPEGTYKVGPGEADAKYGHPLPDPKGGYKLRRLWPMSTADKDMTPGGYNLIDDPRSKYKQKDGTPAGKRSVVETHFQHFNFEHGSEGCVTFQDYDAYSHYQTGSFLHVDNSSSSLEEVQSKISAQLHKNIDWSKIKAPRPPGGTAPRSKTQKGKLIKAKPTGVTLGQNEFRPGHLEAELEGGGRVTQGNTTIVLGPEQLPASAVCHDTTCSPIANGETSVLMLT